MKAKPSLSARRRKAKAQLDALGNLLEGSLCRVERGNAVRFQLTDNAVVVPVSYTGILPDLFREGQGIIAHGQLASGGLFVADEVLAKHDENYMPPEVEESLKQVHGGQVAGGGK